MWFYWKYPLEHLSYLIGTILTVSGLQKTVLLLTAFHIYTGQGPERAYDTGWSTQHKPILVDTFSINLEYLSWHVQSLHGHVTEFMWALSFQNPIHQWSPVTSPSEAMKLTHKGKLHEYAAKCKKHTAVHSQQGVHCPPLPVLRSPCCVGGTQVITTQYKNDCAKHTPTPFLHIWP